MSVVIKTNTMKYKDSNGNYQGFNAIAQESTDQQIANITSAGQAQVNNIQQKGSETLDSIPDDYTELAGDVSDLKSQMDDLADSAPYAPAIIAETELDYVHSDVNLVTGIVFSGNSLAFGTAKYANAYNYMPVYEYTRKLDNNLVTVTCSNGFVIFDGTAQSNATGWGSAINFKKPAPAGKYKLIVYIDAPDSTITAGKQQTLEFQNQSGTKVTDVKVSTGTSDIVVNDITFSETVYKLNRSYEVRGDCVYNNYKTWFGLFPSDATITDTNETVQSGNELAISENIVTTDICTMQHRSVVSHVADTKAYVDDHVPENMLTEADLIYLSPEMYGAVGDGTTDDSMAIQSCIDAAAAAGVPVRGFNSYKIETGINITPNSNKQYTDVFINRLIYSGSGDGVTITGQNNRFACNVLNAYDASSSTSAIKLAGSENTSKYNRIELGRVLAYNDAIVYDATGGAIYYNVLSASRVISRYGNCFKLSKSSGSGRISENDFYGKSMSCVNGYVVYAPIGNATDRFYNLGIENECANGVYGIAHLINCRTGECMNQRKSDLNKGTIIHIPSGVLSYTFLCTNTNVNYMSLDVSGADSFDDRIDQLVSEYENGETKSLSFGHAFGYDATNCHNFIVAGCGEIEASEVASSEEEGIERLSVYGKLIAYYDHKGFVPDIPFSRTVTESDFYTWKRAFPTDFVVGANATIHLDDSYCCIGINEFTVTQTSSYKAIVYDKNNTKIFDGTNLDAGVYRFTCKFVPLPELVVELTGGSTLTYSGIVMNYLYTGTNEEWTIEKLNLVS